MDAYRTLKDATKREDYHHLWDMGFEEGAEEEREMKKETKKLSLGENGVLFYRDA
jgi:hypothetical protein